MKIEVLGGGCARCAQLHDSVVAAVKETGIQATIDKNEDYNKIIEYGITATPAFVVDGKVLSTGNVLKKDEVVALLRDV